MQNASEPRLAVLIDADNVPSANLQEMMEEIAKYGTPTFKRIYADWTKPHVARWKNELLQHAITPIQQYSYTTGKNATDSAMIIDAMDILYTGKVDGFCIISSDSDFTRLALRLREAGMKVIGMGQKKTPAPFIAACDKFVYIEILKEKRREELHEEDEKGKKDTSETDIQEIDKKLIKLLSDTITDVADESGWAFLADVGNLIIKKQPSFDSRNYGYKKLVLLLKNADAFDIDERVVNKGNGNVKHVYVRIKAAKKSPNTNRRRKKDNPPAQPKS
jgi:uncharacterized LabA/DUF88 family protein